MSKSYRYGSDEGAIDPMTILLTQLVMRPALRITVLLQVLLLGVCGVLLLAQARGSHLAASLLSQTHLSAASSPLTPSSDSRMLAAASAPGMTNPRGGN